MTNLAPTFARHWTATTRRPPIVVLGAAVGRPGPFRLSMADGKVTSAATAANARSVRGIDTHSFAYFAAAGALKPMKFTSTNESPRTYAVPVDTTTVT